MMFFRKTLAVLMVLSMFISALPVTGFASDAIEKTAEENIVRGEVNGQEQGEDTPEEETETEQTAEQQAETDSESISGEETDSESISGEETVPEEIQPETITGEETPTKENGEAEKEEEKPVFSEIPEEEKRVAVYLNEEGYETLQKAIDAAGEQNSDIYLHEPIAEDVEIGKNQNITISLNGCGFSGEMVNFGNLTILGEGFFDGVLITRAHHIKEGDITIDYASGKTLVKSGIFSGVLAVEQESDALLDASDALPQLTVEGGTFINDGGDELAVRYVSWNESGNAEYTNDTTAGEILLKGGTFAHYPVFTAPGYHAVDYGGMYGIEEGTAVTENENADSEITSGDDTSADEIVLLTEEDSSETEEIPVNQTEEISTNETEEIPENETGNQQELLTTGLPQMTVSNAPMQTLGLTAEEEISVEGEINAAEEETYTISYNVEVPEGAAVSYVSSTGATLPAAPADTTVPFYGWYTDADFTDGPYTQIPAGSTGNRIFYARWQYSVQVYVNNNSYGHAVYEGTIINSSNTVQILSGRDFVLELVPETENCRVSMVQVNGSDVEFTNESVTIKSDSMQNNMKVDVFFDQWPTHRITFNYNDGGETESKESYIKNGTALVLETPVRAGYIFKGWLCALDGETYSGGDEYTVSHSTEFTAQWELAEYTLTYHVNNSSVGTIPSQTFTINTDSFSLFNPAIPNAVFLNWYEAEDFSGDTISGIEKGTARNIDVYGKWEYSVFLAYNSEGGTVTATKPVADGKTTVTTGESVTLTATANDGYVLKEVTVKSASSAPETVSGNTYTFSDMIEDAFFTAEFLKPYTAVFIANDGSGSQSSQTVIPGNAVTLPERIRSGYQFNGWLCSEDNKVHAPGNYVPSGDVTFTAQWEKIPTYYKVYVYYNTFGTVAYNGELVPNRSYFEVEEGKNVTLYFNPLSTSYYPYNCTVNNVKRGSITSLTLENIQENQVVSVTFAPTFARPMTGDESHLLLWAALMAVSGTAGVILFSRRKKKQQ